MQLIHFLVFVAVLRAAYAQPVGEDAAPATQLEDVADLGAVQPKEGEGARSPRWLWGGWGGSWSPGWSGGYGSGWGSGWGNGWGSGWKVSSYPSWSSGSSYWW